MDETNIHKPLTYEETPPIEPITEPEPDLFPPKKPENKTASIVTAVVFFILLFIVGFWLSGTFRKYIGNIGNVFEGTKKTNVSPTPTPKEFNGSSISGSGEDRFGSWNVHHVLNGRTRTVYEGISFKLPTDVLPPICDGSACGSQGTYLPGGTRFTVALRGTGQVLPDYRGKLISDLKGIEFAETPKIILGQTATEFNGSFVGTTVGGYVFTRMRGVMMPVTDTISLEMNHFSPQGITANFESDDLIFENILETLVLPIGGLEKGGVVVSPTPLNTPMGSPSATPAI